MNERERNEAEWRNPGNWHAGWLGIYRSEDDTRVIVPKRSRIMGWTINTGRPAGKVVAFGLLFAVGVTIVRRWLS